MIPRHLQIAFALMLCVLLALGIWAWTLKRHADAIQAHEADTRPAAPPVAGVTLLSQFLSLLMMKDCFVRARSSSPFRPNRVNAPVRHLRALLAIYVEKPSPHHSPAGPTSGTYTW